MSQASNSHEERACFIQLQDWLNRHRAADHGSQERIAQEQFALWVWTREMPAQERRLFSCLPGELAISVIAQGALYTNDAEKDEQGAHARRLGRAKILASLAGGANINAPDPLFNGAGWLNNAREEPAFESALRSLEKEKSLLKAGSKLGKGFGFSFAGATAAIAIAQSSHALALAPFCAAVALPIELACFSALCVGAAAGYQSISKKAPQRARLIEILEMSYPDLANDGFFLGFHKYAWVSKAGDPLGPCLDAIADLAKRAPSDEAQRLLLDLNPRPGRAYLGQSARDPSHISWPEKNLAILMEGWEIESSTEPALALSQPQSRSSKPRI